MKNVNGAASKKEETVVPEVVVEKKEEVSMKKEDFETLHKVLGEMASAIGDISKRLSALEGERVTPKVQARMQPGVLVLPRGEGEVPEVVVSRRGLPDPNTYYAILRVPAPKAQPPQAIKCMVYLMRAVASEGVEMEVDGQKMKVLSEAKAQEVLAAVQSHISSNQTAWHIFTYYRAKLIGGGYLRQVVKY